MLHHPTLDKLQQLRLTGMHQALLDQDRTPEIDQLSFEERLGLLVDRELTQRDDRRLQTRLRQAKLKHRACLEDIDYRHPRGLDKALIQQLANGRWILAALRHQTFFSLSELNRAIRTLLTRLNSRPFRKLPGCRQTLFETLDRPALRPLPDAPYVYAEWRKARVHIDYHVEVDRHYYSVPYQLVKHAIEIRLTAHTVECFFQGNRVASHVRAHLPGRHTTLPEHMPTAHRQYAEWTPERLVRWAEKSGPATAALIQRLLERRTHPQQGFRSALGIMRLGKSYGADRLEAACARALELGALSYRSLESILRQGLDRTPVTTPEEAPDSPVEHEHLRGADYYH